MALRIEISHLSGQGEICKQCRFPMPQIKKGRLAGCGWFPLFLRERAGVNPHPASATSLVARRR